MRPNKRARRADRGALRARAGTHCGAFAALEEELMALGAAEGEGLLDRADALVWALTALTEQGDGPRLRVL